MKLGTDPELFIFDKKHARYVSAHDIVPGTKNEPFKVHGGAVQPDGLAAEFNIDAVETHDEWERNIKTVLETLSGIVRERDRNYELRFVPFAEFEKEYFASLPRSCKILGCDPDYNYKGVRNPNPGDKFQDQSIRTAAGHIHIGWTDGQELVGAHLEDCKFVSRYFKETKCFEPLTGEEKERLKYYGMNGSFRPKTYGVELRQPSNIWVASPVSRLWMYELIQQNMADIYSQTEDVRKAA